MRQDPETYLKYRKNIELNISEGFGVFYKNTPESNAARDVQYLCYCCFVSQLTMCIVYDRANAIEIGK